MDWLTVGSSFDAASFRQKQEEALKASTAAQDASFQRAAEALAASSSSEDEQGNDSPGPASPRSSAHDARAQPAPKSRRRRREEDRLKHKKKHKRRSSRDEEIELKSKLERAAGVDARASQVSRWAPRQGHDVQGPLYYFDTGQDASNVAFEGLYRRDIPLYRRADRSGFAARRLPRQAGPTQGGSEQSPSLPRYFSPALWRLERSTRMRRWKPPARSPATADAPAPKASFLPAPSFIPLETGVAEGGHGQAPATGEAETQGLTTLDETFTKTAAFSAATRERPQDLQTWLDFAALQDEVARSMARGGKGVERAATEKKIAILERALHHHPGSERLLLALLEAAKVICDEAEMARRWRAVLEAHPDSPALWRAFLYSRLRAFSCFNAMEVEAQYAAAVRSVAGALALRRARGADLAELEAWERQLAGLALQGVLLMRQSGHTEAFVGSIQLLLEYTLCRPDDWPEDALPDMFPDYWAGRSPLLGEPGSRGWAAWLAGWQAAPAPVSATVPRREPAAAAAAPEEKDESGATAGVWTGWEELGPAIRRRFGHGLDVGGPQGDGLQEAKPEPSDDRVEVEGDQGDGSEADEQEQAMEEPGEEEEEEEESEEALMARLGLELEAALESGETMTDAVLSSWLESEESRSAAQWHPLRVLALDPGGEADPGCDGQRAVAWGRVSHLALPLASPRAREEVVLGCLTLLGTSLEGVPLASEGPVARALAEVAETLEPLADMAWPELQVAEGAPLSGATTDRGLQAWYACHPTRRDFVLRLLRQLVELKDPAACRRHAAAALLHLTREERGVQAARAMAKELLAARREDLDLWETYFHLEWAAGNVKAARKVALACLSSASHGRLTDPGAPLAPLALAAARLESGARPGPGLSLPAGGCHPSTLRTLAWLGSGGGVALAADLGADALGAPALIAARKGFQAHLSSITGKGGAVLTWQSAAMVAAAAAFEQAAGGGPASALILLDGTLRALIPPRQACNDGEGGRVLGSASAAAEALALARAELALDASALQPPAVTPAAAADWLLRGLLAGPLPASATALALARRAVPGAGLARVRRTLRCVAEAAPTPEALAATVGLEEASGAPRGVVRRARERGLGGSQAAALAPGAWRALVRGEARAGAGPEAVRRAFLRAVAACPWSKALWLDGVALLLGATPARELGDLVDVMRGKQVALRTETLEAVLQQLESAPAAGMGEERPPVGRA
ncbi:hypothetical protein ACKKBG_A33510 [Auxenochlorella protothecoides x Auxenochlorella symbiontica]